MKKTFALVVLLILAISCKETEFSPEGPTDVRIRNITNLDFRNVIINTSEYDEDADTITLITSHATTDYMRFKKAYPKIKLKADIQLEGSTETFTTGEVDFQFLQYLSTQRVTFEVFISSMSARKLEVDLIPEEELILN